MQAASPTALPRPAGLGKQSGFVAELHDECTARFLTLSAQPLLSEA